MRIAVLALVLTSFLLSGPWRETFRQDMQVELSGLIPFDPGKIVEGDVRVIIVLARRLVTMW